MKENVDANSGSGRKRPDEPQEPLPNGTRPATGQALMRPISNDAAPQAKLTAWSVMDVLARRWYWLVLGGAVFAAGFYLLGDYLVKPKFTATAQLLRYDTPVSESLKPAQISSETFSGLIRSPELLRAVGEQEIPPIPGDKLAKCIKVDPQPDSDLVKVLLATRDPKLSVRLLNNYLTNVVTFTTKIQKEQVSKVANEYLRIQVQQMDSDIKEIENRLRGVPDAGSLSNKMSEVGGHVNSLSNQLASPRLPSVEVVRLNERISTAMGELHDLLEKYTEEHPYVQRKQALINDLNAQKERAFTNTAAVPANLAFTPMRPTGLQGLDPEIDIIHIKMRSLEDARQQLVNRQREAAAYVDNPPGIVRIFAIADPTTVQTNMRLLKIIIMAIFGCVLSMGASLGLVVVTELTDKRLKTSEDVRRVTKLPVLTVL